MLLSWEVIDHEAHGHKKAQIGKYMSKLYSGRVPWAKLQEAQDHFILPEYLPDDCTLTQYHHIHIDNANSILKHWTQRQAAG
ncbi:hypothetical protein V8E53_002370 [Lactarius tabidus]